MRRRAARVMTGRLARWTAPVRRRLNLWLLLGFFFCAGVALVAVNAAFVLPAMRGRFADVCGAARRAYERGGPDALSLLLEGAEFAPGGHLRLLDAAGRDVMTGAVPAAAEARPRMLASSGVYSCVAEAPRGRPPLPFGPMSWVLPFVSVLCCTVGIYVTWRMRRIEAVVKHFGEGKLAVRMASDSRDAIGRLAQAFNQMAERIETLVESNQRLCADMAHELRSPLARLMLAIPGARRGSESAVSRIEAEASRIHDLVDELLSVSRAEVDPAALEIEEVGVESLLTEIADHCSIEADDRGCAIKLLFFRPGTIMADVELVRRAVENVLRNAVQHSDNGSQILLSSGGDAESVTISVRDWGPGVPEAALGEIFRPFYRVDAARRRSTGGVGLGLAIAQRIVALHGGSIRAENAGPGLAVILRLPRTREMRTTNSCN